MKADGELIIKKNGHRKYVGGMWEKIGKLQFRFLVEKGLKPCHCFLDIGCGSLRGGVHFIQYLDPTNYMGIDKEALLLKLGINSELATALRALKKPELLVSPAFEFNKLSKIPDFSIAQSLFTHLTSADIALCLANLRIFVKANHMFYATFFLGKSAFNPQKSNSRLAFSYSVDEMISFGESKGWRAHYIGRWNHPTRGQVIINYTPQ